MLDQPLIDVDRVLRKTRIRKKVFLAMLEQSIPYLHERMDALQHALTEGIPDQVSREAHAIKGSAAALGMDAVQQQAFKMERLGKGTIEGDLRAEAELLQAELSKAVQYAVTIGACVERAPTTRGLPQESPLK